MARHLQRELERLKKRILSLGAMVEERVRTATRALEQRDMTRAAQIISTDYEVDGVPIQKKEWDKRIESIIDDETFRLLTSPTYFNSLHWENRRRILSEACGNNLSDDDVIASNKDLSELSIGRLHKIKSVGLRPIHCSFMRPDSGIQFFQPAQRYKSATVI